MDGRAEGAVAIKQEDHVSGHWHNFPAGLRLLVVDDDPLCLKVVEQMLRKCSYDVTTCTNATLALNLLREKSTEYDLVLSDVYMPDMDGFKLLEVVGLEMDLPVIMMSSNGDTSNVLRGVTHGACDYLIKPVRLEELRNLWQHVVRRRRQLNLDLDSDEQSQERDEDQGRNKRKLDTMGFMSDQLRLMGAGNGGVSGANGTTANGALGGSSGLGGGLGNAADDLGFENGSNKKARVVWSVEMHQQFVNAVNQLGIDKAVPKKILEIMNVDGLTRENVASHLQKYRLYLKRVSGVQQSAQNRAVKPPPPQQPQSPPGASQPQQQQQQQPLPASGPNGAAAGGGGAGQMPSGGGAAAALAGILGTGGPGGGGGGACPGGGAGPPPGGGSIGPDGGPPGVGLNPATIAGAMTATAGGFPPPPPPPHPAALLAANPMMAAAGLNPLLGPMGGLGVGPLGPLNPLNSMPMPGMQPPLGLLPGLPGGAGQPGLGPLGPMGLPGLGPLPSLPGGLPLNPMANGLQQMAAANLMQGMAGLGPLPPLSMNGLMGPLPGVGLPGPQQHLFPQQPQALQQQHQQQQQQQQLQQQQKDLLTVQKQQQAAIGAAVPLPHTQQQQQQPGLPQTVTVGTPSLANPTAAALLHQHTCGQHNNLSCSSPHPHHHHHQQQQQVLQSQHSPHLAANKHPLATVVLNGVVDSGGRGAHMHVGTGTHGSDPGGGVVGVLDIPPDMIGGLIEDSFGGVPSAGGQVTPGTGTAVLDPAMLLEESDNPDFAAVFQEMSSYGASSGNVGGSVAASVVMGQVLLPQPPIVDAVGGLGITSETARVDEDFLNLLFKS